MVKDRKAHGTGKTYSPDKNGKLVLRKEGTVANDALAEGNIYFDDGTVKSAGRYDSKGRISSGRFWSMTGLALPGSSATTSSMMPMESSSSTVR